MEDLEEQASKEREQETRRKWKEQTTRIGKKQEEEDSEIWKMWNVYDNGVWRKMEEAGVMWRGWSLSTERKEDGEFFLQMLSAIVLCDEEARKVWY